MRSIPAPTDEIRIEASFEAFSTLLLVVVPLSTWAYIPQNPAIFALTAVKSSTVLPFKDSNEARSELHGSQGSSFSLEQSKGEGRLSSVIKEPDPKSVNSSQNVSVVDDNVHGDTPRRTRVVPLSGKRSSQGHTRNQQMLPVIKSAQSKMSKPLDHASFSGSKPRTESTSHAHPVVSSGPGPRGSKEEKWVWYCCQCAAGPNPIYLVTSCLECYHYFCGDYANRSY